jgi:putative FmdB family regulatory protein
MPTYEYACSSCNNEWEFEQSIKDAALTECPACKQPTAKRQISRGTGFILKGSGWYSDLYSSSSNKAPADKGDKGEKSAGEKAGSEKAGSEKSGASDKGDKGGSSDSGTGGSSAPPAASPGSSSTPAASAA